ncbi:hypothetical protein ACO0QE_002647 [Hanseniaspora vineae]
MLANRFLCLHTVVKSSVLRTVPCAVSKSSCLRFSTLNSKIWNEANTTKTPELINVQDEQILAATATPTTEIPPPTPTPSSFPSLSKTLETKEHDNSPEKDYEVTTFKALRENKLIDPLISKALSRTGFVDMTPVQSKTLKPILENENYDIIARAKTGTGKTLAFLIPIFESLCKTRRDSQYMVKSVIVAPTRDLALQIEEEIKKVFYKNNYGLEKFPSMSLIGGVKMYDQIRKMRKIRPNIVVCTPGRLLDMLSDDRLANEFFKFVDFKIFDEADRLLEIGFKEDMEQISDILNSLSAKPENHIRSLLFSATFSKEVKKLSQSIMNKPDFKFIDTVDKNEPEVQEKINQKLVVVDSTQKQILESLKYLTDKVANKETGKYIVFVPVTTFTSVFANLFKNILYDNHLLNNANINVLHGKLQQERRTKTVQRFKRSDDKMVNFLFCTDVGARGMDYPNINEVIQISLPSETANYIHRIGRTARGSSAKGESIAFVTKPEHKFFDVLAREKKVFVDNKVEDFEPFEDKYNIAESVKSEMVKNLEAWNETFYSLLGFHRSSASEFKTNMTALAQDCCISFDKLTGGTKLHVSPSSINRIFGNQLLRQIVEYIDYDGPMPREEPSRSRYGGSNSRNRFNRFDSDGQKRSRDYNNNDNRPKGGFSNRGGFSDRSNYSNRNNNYSSRSTTTLTETQEVKADQDLSKTMKRAMETEKVEAQETLIKTSCANSD